MKVAYMIKSLSKGGAERVIANLANYSISQGDEAYIFMLNKNGIQYPLSEKIKIIYCNDNKKNAKFGKVFLFKKWTKIMRKHLNEICPDIILSFLPQVNFVSLLANNGKFPIIISARNDSKIEFPNRVYKLLMKYLYPKTDGFIYQTTDQKQYFDQLKINKEYAVIPNPVNDDFLIEPYAGKRKKCIVSVGRLIEQKNQKLLIDSFSEICSKYPDYKLIIYGEGKLREHLSKYIKKLNLNDKVILAGNVNNIIDKIYKSSLFVLSSDYEGMPNALMEAMALGIPSISTNCPCGGPRELIINNENGILVDVNNKEQMVEAITRVLNDKRLSNKLSKNAHRDICEKFNSASAYENYYIFFKKIIEEKNRV